MTIKIVQGSPEQFQKEVNPIVEECFEGIWTAKDLKQLLTIPHESKVFMLAYENNKLIGYAYVVADYVEEVDIKIASILELGVLPDFRNTNVVESFIDTAIDFSKSIKAELLEQSVSIIDQWLIPKLLDKNLKPSEIKADREISSFNEAKLIMKNLKKNPKLNVIMNQLFFEKNDALETHIVESEDDFNEISRKDPIAFGSIISVDKSDELDSTLNELTKTKIEWDEIGITFDYKI